MKPDEKAGQDGPFWTLPVQCTKCVCRYYTEDKWRLSIQESAIQNRQVKRGEKTEGNMTNCLFPLFWEFETHHTRPMKKNLCCSTNASHGEVVWRKSGEILAILFSSLRGLERERQFRPRLPFPQNDLLFFFLLFLSLLLQLHSLLVYFSLLFNYS